MGRRLRPLVALLLMSWLLAGCGSDDGSGGTSDEKASVPVTPRALAAGMLRHLDDDHVTSVSGSRDTYGISAMVALDSGSVDTVSVTVMPKDTPQAVRRCGMDAGFTKLECRDRDGLFELVRRKAGDPRLPVLSGRSYDNRRGGVLVQVWGRADPAAEDLARELMKDPLLGVRTSPELVRAGEELKDFTQSVRSVEITRGSQPRPQS